MTIFGFTFGTLLWIMLALFVCYVLFSWRLYESAIDREKGRDENGMLQINPNSFAIKNIYQLNFGKDSIHKRYPHDICQLFWGIFNFTWSAMSLFIANKVIELILTVLWIFFATLLMIFGRLPKKMDLFSNAESFSGKRFRSYERRGVNEDKKWFAPWKIVVPALLLLLVSTGHTHSILVVGRLISIIITTCGMIWAFIIIAQILKISPPLTATKEFIKGYKEKKCILITTPPKPVEKVHVIEDAIC